MELQEWRNKFASRILRRGENYYYDGAVRAMKWDGKTIAATVVGTETGSVLKSLICRNDDRKRRY